MAVVDASDRETPLDFGLATQSRNLWVDAWRRLRRNKLAVTGGLILIFLCVVALAAPLIAPYD
jgi:ABC-type antimicrobial peptide transport system permease subunit